MFQREYEIKKEKPESFSLKKGTHLGPLSHAFLTIVIFKGSDIFCFHTRRSSKNIWILYNSFFIIQPPILQRFHELIIS